jgi:hypothetical protein
MKFAKILLCCLITTSLHLNSQCNLVKKLADGNPGNVTISGMVSDSKSNFYFAGDFKNYNPSGNPTGVDFDPGSGVSRLLSAGNEDIYIQKLDSNGSLLWVKRIGGVYQDIVRSFSIDSNDNIVITGEFTGVVDFNPGSAVNNLISPNNTVNGYTNYAPAMFVLKLDASGNYVWARTLAGSYTILSGSITPISLVNDKNGNIYIGGVFANAEDNGKALPTDFDPGAGTFNMYTNNGSIDQAPIFLLKLTSSGTFSWAINFGGGVDRVRGGDLNLKLAFSHFGQIQHLYVVNSLPLLYSWDVQPGGGQTFLTGAGGQEFYVNKIDAGGSFKWTRKFGGGGKGTKIVCRGIKVIDSGHFLLTGSFNGLVDFDPNSGLDTMSGRRFTDGYCLKMSSSGDKQWVRQFKNMDGQTQVEPYQVNTDFQGNIFFVGWAGRTDFDPGPDTSLFVNTGFLSKLDKSGKFISITAVGQTARWGADAPSWQNYHINGSAIPYYIVVDKNANVYSSGVYGGDTDFDPDSGMLRLAGYGANNFFYKTKDFLKPVINPGGSIELCSGDSVVLKSNYTSGNTWSNGAKLNSIAIKSSGLYSVTVAKGSCNKRSNDVKILVNPLPSKPKITVSGPTTLCLGDSVFLNSSNSAGNTWSNGTTQRSLAAKSSGEYFVTATLGKCKINSDTVRIVVDTFPSKPIISVQGKTTFCSGDSVVLSANSSSNTSWSNGLKGQSITVKKTGTFIASDANNKCISKSDSVKVTVKPLPGIIKQPVDQSVAIGQTATFSIKTDATSFQWQGDFGSGFINLNNNGTYAGVNRDTLIVKNIGSMLNNAKYRCMVGLNLCNSYSNSAKILVNTSSIFTNVEYREISVFPNPAQDKLEISGDASRVSELRYKIINLSGQVLLEGNCVNYKSIVNISDLSDGSYIIVLNNHSYYHFVKRSN